MPSHEYYISRCFELAIKGAGHVSPNPMVGSVLVWEDTIIGEGYHERYGAAHAEVNCIQSVNEDDNDLIEHATLYVSLEPCCHFGKTPPCTDFILQHGIKKVVIACKDFSGKINGQGIQTLKEAGVEVIENILEHEAIELNRRFFTLHQKKRPYIILKWAQSKEGFIGNETQQIKLSTEATDKLVHQWRAEEDAICVGYNTVKIDNPKLNVRHAAGKNPIRIVYDKNLELEQHHHLFDQSQKTIIFNSVLAKEEKNIEWITVEEKNYLLHIVSYLHWHNILSIIVEGGCKLLQQFIDLNLWDEARCIQTNTSLAEGIKAPVLTHHHKWNEIESESDVIYIYKNTRQHT